MIYMDIKPKTSNRILLLVLGVVSMGPFVLVGRELLNNKVLFWGTPALQFVPWWVEGSRQIFAGQFPLWNVLSGMGAPLLANYQSAFFYPPNWLLFILNSVGGTPGVAWGFTFLAMLHLIWGGWGMVYVLRKLGASPLSQAIGGTAFALSGYLVGRLEFISMVWVAAWLPWVIRYTDDIASPVFGLPKSDKKAWLPGKLIVCLSFQLLAGHAQLTWYTIELAGLWLLAGVIRSKAKQLGVQALLRFMAAGIVAAGISAVQLLPTVEYLLQSQRASQVEITEALTYSFWPWRLISMVAPDFFGNPGEGTFWGYASFWEDHAYLGLLVMIMVFSTVSKTLRKKKQPQDLLDAYALRFLWIIGIGGLLLAFGKFSPLYPFLYKYIPTFDMFQAPARYMVWVVFSFIILAAVGMDGWIYPSGKGLYWLRLGTAGAFAIAVGAGLGSIMLSDVRLTFIKATALAGLLGLGVGISALLTRYRSSPRLNLAWQLGVFSLVFFDLLISGWKLNPMVDIDFYRADPSVVERLGSGSNQKRLYMSGGLEYFLKFNRFLRFDDYRAYESWSGLKTTMLPNINLLHGIASVNNFDPFVPARYSAWMNLLDRTTEIRKTNMLSRMNVAKEMVFSGRSPAGVSFVEIESSGEAAWYSCASFLPADEALLLKMAQNEFRTDILYVENPDAEATTCFSERDDAVEVIHHSASEIEIVIGKNRNGWLLLSQVHYPGWTAKIDGQELKTYRGDYLFTAMPVPAGDHSILLKYQPVLFVIGGLLSILMLIGFVTSKILRRIK